MSTSRYAILEALKDDNVEPIRRWINATNLVNKKDRNGQTLLHYAVTHRSVRVMRYLLTKTPNLEEKEENGYTPLGYLVRTCMSSDDDYRVMSIAVLLIEAGANVNTINPYGYTPLHWAARYGDVLLVQEFVKRGANVVVENDHGSTPLHLAVMNGNWNVVIYFGSIGMNMNIRNRQNQAPIHEIVHQPFQVVEALVKWGAEVDARDGQRWTALHHAAYYNRSDAFQALLCHGADASLKAQIGGKGPMLGLEELARANWSDKIIKLLEEAWDVKIPEE